MFQDETIRIPGKYTDAVKQLFSCVGIETYR